MIPLFKLQSPCYTRAIQFLGHVFHLVFRLHLWCSALQPQPGSPSRQRAAAECRVAQPPRPRAPPPRLPVSSCATCCLLYSIIVCIVIV
jgi:hypothetical protein